MNSLLAMGLSYFSRLSLGDRVTIGLGTNTFAGAFFDSFWHRFLFSDRRLRRISRAQSHRDEAGYCCETTGGRPALGIYPAAMKFSKMVW